MQVLLNTTVKAGSQVFFPLTGGAIEARYVRLHFSVPSGDTYTMADPTLDLNGCFITSDCQSQGIIFIFILNTHINYYTFKQMQVHCFVHHTRILLYIMLLTHFHVSTLQVLTFYFKFNNGSLTH